jgi:hypothetical protein
MIVVASSDAAAAVVEPGAGAVGSSGRYAMSAMVHSGSTATGALAVGAAEADGTTSGVAADALLLPTSLTAATVNATGTPCGRPGTRT